MHPQDKQVADWSDNNEKIVRGPYLYLKKLPGKDFRPQMIEAFNTVLKVDSENLSVISQVVEMLHTSSLLVDDVEDNAELRRGYPAAHTVFGPAQTINSANYIYFVALNQLLKLGTHVIDIYTEEMINLHRGQGFDLYWRETLVCPTEEEYIDMVMNKTGGLYRLAVRLMQAVSPTDLDLTELANTFGIIYQIQDDYLNLQSQNYSTNKGYCEDLTEGKFSFPIIHSIRSDTGNKELLNILKQKTNDDTIKQYAVSYMHETGSFQYAKDTISCYAVKSRSIIEKVSAEGYDSSKLTLILEKMLQIS